jgi:hypothetical protein
MNEHSITLPDVKIRSGAFAEFAERLRANGYSPLPIRMDKKRPRGDGWSRYCVTARTAAEIEAQRRRHPSDGLGVCGGYGQLVMIDIDTDDPEIIRLVLSVLPPILVARRGRKGLVAFFLAPPDMIIKSRRLKSLDRRALVEILAGGRQAVVPPTIHPTTQQPYRWTTVETLLTVPRDALPVLHSGELVSDMRRVLADYLLPPRVYPERKRVFGETEALPAAQLRRQLGRAHAILRRWEAQLSGIGEGGRNDGLFSFACAIGYAFWNRLLERDEIVAAMLRACERNGFRREEGRAACLEVIENGFDYAEWDALPVLEDRPYGSRG